MHIISGSWPSQKYKIISAVIGCTLRNARWDTITVKTGETTLGAFGAAGTNGERTQSLTTSYAYKNLSNLTLYGGGVGTQIASGSFVTVTVKWELSDVASTFTLSSSSVEAGKSVTATISASSSAYTHKITAEFGTVSQSTNISAGATSTAITIPISWLNQIPNTQSSTARITLSTYSNSVYVGATTATLTIRAPQSTAPTFTASCAPLLTVGGVTYPSMGSGVYVQSKSGCTAKITGAAAQYGATVKGYSIRGGGYSGTNATLATGLLGSSGTVPFVFRVTDSRGLYTEKTVTISVLAYNPPKVSSLTGWRVNSAGSTAPMGTLGKIKGVWSYTTLGGANTCTVKAYIKPTGGSETTLNAAMASGSTYWVATSAGNMTLAVTTRYVLRLALTDKYGTVSVTADLPSAAFAMHLNAAGNSIAFGKACEKSNAVEIAENRTLWYKGASFTGLLGMVGTGYNLNEDVTAGVYLLTSSTENVPEGVANGICVNFLSRLQTHNFTDNWLWQLVFDAWSKKAFLRRKLNDSDFTAWEPFGSGLEAYPVGSVYMSASATSPASLFGGTWTQIQNRFLVGAGSSYTVGATGGSATVALSVNQMPAHTHIITMARLNGTPASWSTASPYGRYSGDEGGASFTMATGEKGSGAAHENRPPYYAVYMWRRTA